MSDSSQLLRFDHVDVTSGGKSRLQNITFEINKGEQWALLGLNGSGKTTLLQVIAGYVWPTSGTVTSWKGQYGRIDLPALRREIGWVSDTLDDRYRTRAGDSALEVVLSGLYASIGLYETTTDVDREKAASWMSFFGIHELQNRSFASLSQGEKRRTMLARAWMAEPKLLLLDEPCTGLDVKGREEFLSSVESLMSLDDAPALMYVTHHIEEIPASVGSIVLLKDAGIIQKGDKKTVLNDDNVKETFEVNGRVHWEEERPWLLVQNQSSLRQKNQ
ncbi:ABC transporter ATP-binding protein [Salibacterium halotolerans]|uniref:Iron complex transport system ATP-binding protein n=1 Tax=Salibacterium halotolerans TaxID=1884432 RepID=A0A1I5USP0_9BACI|nr:ABC transporter ATP-binding protein [Salibacterium halotolerans]SFP98188.1 iron complex transport system ATP-binding protein [Salibacterium halotolerans]